MSQRMYPVPIVVITLHAFKVTDISDTEWSNKKHVPSFSLFLIDSKNARTYEICFCGRYI